MEVDIDNELKLSRKQRTVFVTGFRTTLQCKEISNFLKQFGEIERVAYQKSSVPEDQNSEFTGSVLATFSYFEEAKSFREIKELKYGNEKLSTLWESEFYREKKIKHAINVLKKNLSMFKKYERFTKDHMLHLSGIPVGVSKNDLQSLFVTLKWPVFHMLYTEGTKDVFLRLHSTKRSKWLIKDLKRDNKVVLFNALVRARFFVNDGDVAAILRKMEEDQATKIKQLEDTWLQKNP